MTPASSPSFAGTRLHGYIAPGDEIAALGHGAPHWREKEFTNIGHSTADDDSLGLKEGHDRCQAISQQFSRMRNNVVRDRIALRCRGENSGRRHLVCLAISQRADQCVLAGLDSLPAAACNGRPGRLGFKAAD